MEILNIRAIGRLHLGNKDLLFKKKKTSWTERKQALNQSFCYLKAQSRF